MISTVQAPTVEDIAGLPARRLSADLVEAVILRRQTLESLRFPIDEAALSREDRSFALALTLAALRNYGALRVIVNSRLAKPLPARRVEIILVLSLAQLMLLKTPAHAAVALGVELAKDNSATRSFAPLVNAVLRRLSEIPTLEIDVKQVLPDWLFQRWQKTYGLEIAENMVRAQLVEPPLDLSVKENTQVWAEKLNGVVLPTGTLRLSEYKGGIAGLPGFEEGAWWVQDAGALLSVLALGDVRGKSVLDLCAAPGGKTAALAARGAHVTALDRSQSRLGLLHQNMQRLKLEAEVICADATKWESPVLYDAILLDAPCSSTGTLRRHPDVAWTKSETDIGKLSLLQANLLRRASSWLKPRGVLVYSTCSLEPEEGEKQIERLLAEDPRFVLQPLGPSEIGGFNQVLNLQGAIRSRPDMLCGQGGIDGFYCARLVLKNESFVDRAGRICAFKVI